MLFQRNSMPTGQDSAPRIFSHFVDYSKVFQRNVVAVFHFWTRAISLIFHWFYNEIRLRQPSFQNWALSIILLMLFQRNCMPAKPHPDFAISLIILMLFHRNLVDFGVSGTFAAFCDFVDNPNAFPSKFRWFWCQRSILLHFAHSLIILMLFHWNFVSFDVELVPNEMGFSRGPSGRFGCADFVDLLTVFQRNGPNSRPALAASPILPFRWYS